MKNRYMKSAMAVAMAAVMSLTATAQVRMVRTGHEMPAPQTIITDTPSNNFHWLKSGKASDTKVMSEYIAPSGRRIAMTTSGALAAPVQRTRAEEGEPYAHVTVTMPKGECLGFLDVLGYLKEVDGWNTMPLVQDETNPTRLDSPAPVNPGIYALLISVVQVFENEEFIFYGYEKQVEVTEDGLNMEADFNDCIYNLTYEMVRPDGSDYLWKTDDAPFVSLDLVYGYLKLGVWADYLVPARVNACDENCSWTSAVNEISHVLPEAYQATGEMSGPFTADVNYSVTSDMYTKSSSDFTIWPSDIEGGYMGIGFMVTKATQAGATGFGSTGCAPGEPYSQVDIYSTMGETVVGDTEYLSQIGTVVGFDTEYGDATVKYAGHQMKVGDTWYTVQDNSQKVDGVWTYMSPLDIFNINSKEQEIQNFKFTPWARPDFSIWVYDPDEYIVADLGAEFRIKGMFHESLDGLDPFECIEEMTIDGKDVAPWSLLEEPMPAGNMVVTFNYGDVCVDGQYPAYVRATTAFYTYSEINNPWISGFQIRCNDKITNNIDPSLPSTMYILGFGRSQRGVLDYNIDWICDVAPEGSDAWTSVTLNPKDTGTDYGAMCEVDLASLGLEPNTWYKVRLRLAEDANNYVEIEMGRCFYMNVPGGLTLPSIDGDVTAESFCDLSGCRLSAPAKGVNIVRYSDGSTRKVLL